MNNPEVITLKLTREQVSRLSMACLSLMHDFEREAREPDTKEDRKSTCERSAAMWGKLRDEVRKQAGFDQ